MGPREDEAGAERRVQQSPEARRARSVLLTIEMLTDQISYATPNHAYTRDCFDVTYWHVDTIMILIDTVLATISFTSCSFAYCDGPNISAWYVTVPDKRTTSGAQPVYN